MVFGGICIGYNNDANQICHGKVDTPIPGTPTGPPYDPVVIERGLDTRITNIEGRYGYLLDKIVVERSQSSSGVKETFKCGGAQGDFTNASPPNGNVCVLKYVSGKTRNTEENKLCSMTFHWECE